MPYRASLVSLMILLFATASQAQLRGGMGVNVGNVHVHIVFDNQRNAGPYLMVRLLQGETGECIATSYTNDVGEVEFAAIPVGSYHVEVSGDSIQKISSDAFDVDNRKMTQTQYVVVHRVEDGGPAPLSSHSATVSAADLNVPGKARKEVDKANEAMAEHDWKKSLQHLNKALIIAPQYATAYNNLGVLYAKMDDPAHEEEALKKALAIDPHFVPALTNYGKLCLREKDVPKAEDLFGKAIAAEPDNADTLMLLAYTEYMDRHFDAAITSALRAHTAAGDHPSFVHYIAARAYQQESKQPQALAQFQQFLKEEPKGPRADHVRADIAKIESTTQQATAR